MKWLQTLVGMSEQELRFLAALIGLCTAGGGVLGYLYGSLITLLDVRRKIDRNNLVVVTLLLRIDNEGGKVLEAITHPTLYELPKVFGDVTLEKRIKKVLPRCKPGHPLLRPGLRHYLAMHRIRITITGLDRAATLAAANGRHNDYNRDSMCFMLTRGDAEGGSNMPFVLEVSPSLLHLFLDKENVTDLILDHNSSASYLPMLANMAIEQQKSAEIFSKNSDEIAAGKQASVWTTDVLTSKVGQDG